MRYAFTLSVVSVLVLLAITGALRKPAEPLVLPQVFSPRSCGYQADSESGISVECFWLFSGGFQLPVAVFSPLNQHRAELLVYLSGGPGSGMQTGYDNLEDWFYWYQLHQPGADLVVFTPRGTPGSQSYLHCDRLETESLALLGRNATLEEEFTVGGEAIRDCLVRYQSLLALQNPGLDLGGAFASGAQANDSLMLVEQLTQRFHYTRTHLWGVSYGTRVALKAAQLVSIDTLKPEIASLILDSVYPFNHGRQSEWAELQQAGMAMHQQYFSQQPVGGYTTFDALYASASSRLADPLRLEVSNWYGGQAPEIDALASLAIYRRDTLAVVLNRDRLLALAGFSLYSPQLAISFQQALAQWLTTGSTELLEQFVEVFLASSFDPAFSTLVFFATECADNPRDTDADYARAFQAFPRWRELLDLQRRHDVCQLPVFSSSERWLGNYATDIPTLIISGEKDPVTPASWARELHAQLPESTLIEVQNQGHGVLSSGGCSAELITQWLAAWKLAAQVKGGEMATRDGELGQFCQPSDETGVDEWR